ncbi:interleukin-32 isoform X2 [Meles meles]|uniref:interleukin-32 isoform X2 n=1 Tax=Meles meles TaxID=9662 RepID=UPI001E69FF49|nr:interleukin-32 isoform X2 [Meles meles]
MGFSKSGKDPNEALRLELEELALWELEDGVDEALLNTVDLNYQNDSQDSSPLLPEVQQELRSRLGKSSVISREGQDFKSRDPRESFSGRVLRLFQRLLGCLLQKWRALLAWLRAMAAGLQALCRAVEAVWSVFKDFCSSSVQALEFGIQT